LWLPLIRVATVGFFLVAVLASLLHAENKQAVWPEEGIEDFSLTEAHGQTVTKADLLGKPWLACFIFTRCLGPCPLVSEQMEILQNRLKDLDVRLVSITVDPDRDTPDDLLAYAKKYHADPDRWWFLTGDKAEIFRLIRGSFKMIVADEPDPKPGFEIMHSITIMHVNAEGRVMGQYNARNDVDMARLRRVLLGKSDAADKTLIDKADREEEEYAAEQERLRAQALREDAEEEAAATKTAPPAARGIRKDSPSMTYGQEGIDPPAWVYRLPAVNASLNGLATVLLVTGWVLVKRRKLKAHEYTMLASFLTSTLFLFVYLVYHGSLWYFTGEGNRKFAGSGAIKVLYLTILFTHIILAAAVPVLAGMTIWRAVTAQWERHKSLARITFPIWLYVSVTGVIIYFMLYHWPTG
jgi:protein SCO1/2/putative membrane protein